MGAFHVRSALGLLLAIAGLFSAAGPTTSAFGAEFGIAPGGFTVEMLDSEGNPENRAGSHPDLLQINFALNLEGSQARDLEFDLPPGLGGSSSAVPQCPQATVDNEEECPPETQVGLFEVVLASGLKAKLPLFQLEPQPGQFFALGSLPAVNLPFESAIRPADFGITLKSNEIPKEPEIAGGRFELWGVPADHQEGTTIPRRPFLTAPMSCGPVNFTFRTRSWQEGAPWLSAAADTGAPLTGCESLPFRPALDLGLSNPIVDSPTGMQIDLSLPDEDPESEIGDAQIKNVAIEFPDDIGLSPGGAEGLVACTDAQFGLGSVAEAQCPDESRIGAVEFSSPAIGGALGGTVYLGAERPGERMRSFLVVAGPGITLKFTSTLETNPVTGRLSTVMRDLPPVPVQRISLSFDGGPGALLASPLTCGPAVAIAKFEPHGGGPPVESTASVPIEPIAPGSPCTGIAPFSPQFASRSTTPKAGRLTTFSTTLRRQAGEQLPSRFSTSLPAGLSASLGTVQTCPSASAMAGTCPLESKIGSTLVKVGSGPNPAALHGNVYLTDPYRRAPFGLLMSFRATIGPFDLGVIALRAAAELDRRSGRLTVTTDRMPDQVDGVPIRFQTVELAMDRPGFVRNPTSCSPNQTDATIESQSGVLATATSPLVLHGCRELGFKPDIRMRLEGREELHKHGSPTLRITTRLRKGDANLRAMKMSLPPVLDFKPGSLKAICSRLDAAEGACSSGSRIGTAIARTSILNEPLRGPIYMAQPSGSGQPDMWVSLEAGGVQMSLRSRTFATRRGHLVTKLAGLPDLGLSTFSMRLGGETQIISLAVNPCAHGRPRRFVSDVAATGQNGTLRKFHARIGMKARCAR